MSFASVHIPMVDKRCLITSVNTIDPEPSITFLVPLNLKNLHTVQRLDNRSENETEFDCLVWLNSTGGVVRPSRRPVAETVVLVPAVDDGVAAAAADDVVAAVFVAVLQHSNHCVQCVSERKFGD